MALPFSEPRRQSNILHHTLNIIVQQKHLEEALTCLVESILYIRSRGKLMLNLPRGFREKPKSSKLTKCENFNFDYYSVQSKELKWRIEREICRFRWLSCVFTNASTAEFYMNFYQCDAPPESTTDYVSYISRICETWQINISIVRLDDEKASKQQIEEMITTLTGCLAYIRQHRFSSDLFSNAMEYSKFSQKFDMSFTDISPCHFFFDTKFPALAM